MLAEITAPPALADEVARVRAIDQQQLAGELARAGLTLPPDIRIELIPERDPRIRNIPVWIVGLASGTRDIVILPERIGVSPDSYPYDTLEHVVWHEVVHLALSRQAGDGRLPRWFHEGVAMSVEGDWGLSNQIQLLVAANAWPGIGELGRLFASDSQPETALGYQLAAALVADVRERHGLAVPGAIATRVARGASFADAFARETGETPDAAAAQAWDGYRRWSSWIPVLTSASSLWVAIMGLAIIAFAVRLRKRVLRRRAWDEEESAREEATREDSAERQAAERDD